MRKILQKAGGTLAFVGLIAAVVLVASTARLAPSSALPSGERPAASPKQTTTPTEVPHEPESPEPVTVPLPEIPTPTRDPRLYDENGCLLGPGGEIISCPAPPLPEPTEGPAERAGTEGETLQGTQLQEEPLVWRRLYGFKGPYYATELKAGEVIVLEQAVSTTVKGAWRAWGLVRNEIPEAVGQVVVMASLLGADGAVLDMPSAEVPVDPLRPGEPGPFAITSTVEAEEVASVEWVVEWGSPNPRVPPEATQVVLLTFWELPYGDREPIHSSLCGNDEGEPPYPYLLAGSVENRGQAELPKPGVVAAWLDKGGRVVWVAKTELYGCYSCPPLRALRQDGVGSYGDFCFVVSDAESGPRLYNFSQMLWGVGR
ncbi:MAG: FxLYD domain-containing protein [Anaerolineae bacterium]